MTFGKLLFEKLSFGKVSFDQMSRVLKRLFDDIKHLRTWKRPNKWATIFQVEKASKNSTGESWDKCYKTLPVVIYILSRKLGRFMDKFLQPSLGPYSQHFIFFLTYELAQ